MGFLSTTGKIIMALAVLGSGAGIIISLASGNFLAILLSLFGLVGGIYVGYLGVKVEEIDERPTLSRTIRELDERLKRIENPPPKPTPYKEP